MAETVECRICAPLPLCALTLSFMDLANAPQHPPEPACAACRRTNCRVPALAVGLSAVWLSACSISSQRYASSRCDCTELSPRDAGTFPALLDSLDKLRDKAVDFHCSPGMAWME
jgi:hypothetical protein